MNVLYVETMFGIGDCVYLKTDREQSARIVTGITITPTGQTYRLSCGTVETFHYGVEISIRRDVSMALDIHSPTDNTKDNQ